MAQDRGLNPAHWQELIQFLQATGLRRREVQQVRVEGLLPTTGVVHVRRGKGGRERLVPVLPEGGELLARLQRGRAPEERVFARVPSHLDIPALRRAYAQERCRRRRAGCAE
uniref:Tyr recombinase domain-containing protein n=1 Tax=Thermogemmatispora argillosa TaxID=2045280 RepID=A0A455T160_9CHLR|nr:hypothetical protein KTA_11410 [Thermogemmatispora argillosa]